MFKRLRAGVLAVALATIGMAGPADSAKVQLPSPFKLKDTYVALSEIIVPMQAANIDWELDVRGDRILSDVTIHPDGVLGMFFPGTYNLSSESTFDGSEDGVRLERYSVKVTDKYNDAREVSSQHYVRVKSLIGDRVASRCTLENRVGRCDISPSHMEYPDLFTAIASAAYQPLLDEMEIGAFLNGKNERITLRKISSTPTQTVYHVKNLGNLLNMDKDVSARLYLDTTGELNEPQKLEFYGLGVPVIVKRK